MNKYLSYIINSTVSFSFFFTVFLFVYFICNKFFDFELDFPTLIYGAFFGFGSSFLTEYLLEQDEKLRE